MTTDLTNHPMVPLPYQVQRVHRELPGVFTLELAPENPGAGLALPFSPGQFSMLYIFGVGEVPISFSGDSARPGVLVHTIRDVGAITGAITRLRQGHILGVRGPFGSSWPTQEVQGNDVVIVAGGLGLAPLRPAIYWLLAHREQVGRIVLLYGTRTPQDILYRRELQTWRSRFDLDAEVTVDRTSGSWKGNVGVVTKLIPRASFDTLNTVALVCGPEVMMRFTVNELQKQGVAWENIYISMERNMKCAVGFCGHCQFANTFVCRDGPVFRYDRIQHFFTIREV